MDNRFHPTEDGSWEGDRDQDTDTDQDESQNPVTTTDEEEDPTVLRRLVQADALVREGRAHVDGAYLCVPLIQSEQMELVLKAPLPPDPLEPVIGLRIAEDILDSASRETFFRIIKDAFDAVLAGPVILRMQPDSAEVRWSPRPVSMEVEAQDRFMSLAEHVAAALNALQSGDALETVEQRLNESLTQHQQRGEILSRNFTDYALLRLPSVGLVHLLAYQTTSNEEDDPLLLAYQTNAGLWSIATGKGFNIALRFPGLLDADRRGELAELLIDVFERRFGLKLEQSSDYDLLGDWENIDSTCLFSSRGRAGLSFPHFLLSLKHLFRFSKSLIELVRQNQDPFDLIGVRPGSAGSDRLTSSRGLKASSTGLAGGVKEGPPDKPGWKAVLDRLDKQVAETHEAMVPSDKSPSEQRPAARVTKPERPALDSLSAREVVRKLGAEEAVDMDVFLSHPGYNVSKTVDIMAIAFSLPKEEALAICERAPCLIIGPVTRTKASQLKLILEGTGARIRIVPTGLEGE